MLTRKSSGADRPFPVWRATAGAFFAQNLQQDNVVDPRSALAEVPHLFTGSSSTEARKIWEKCEAKSVKLGEVASVNFGKQLRDRKKFTNDVISVDGLKFVPSTHTPSYTGKDVNRYIVRWGGLASLDDEVARKGGCWNRSRHEVKNKLLTRQIGRVPSFAIDFNGWHCLNTIFMVSTDKLDPFFVLGVLNSRLLGFLWLERFYDKRDTFPKIKGDYLKMLPIRRIDSATAKARCERIVSLARKMVELHELAAEVRTPHERTTLDRQVAATDASIDREVYALYGLTDEEVLTVEAGTEART